MIASITEHKNIILFTNQWESYTNPFNWIDMIRDCFPNTYVGCYAGYKNCIVFEDPYNALN
jgi:hypothetical protein